MTRSVTVATFDLPESVHRALLASMWEMVLGIGDSIMQIVEGSRSHSDRVPAESR